MLGAQREEADLGKQTVQHQDLHRLPDEEIRAVERDQRGRRVQRNHTLDALKLVEHARQIAQRHEVIHEPAHTHESNRRQEHPDHEVQRRGVGHVGEPVQNDRLLCPVLVLPADDPLAHHVRLVIGRIAEAYRVGRHRRLDAERVGLAGEKFPLQVITAGQAGGDIRLWGGQRFAAHLVRDRARQLAALDLDAGDHHVQPDTIGRQVGVFPLDHGHLVVAYRAPRPTASVPKLGLQISVFGIRHGQEVGLGAATAIVRDGGHRQRDRLRENDLAALIVYRKARLDPRETLALGVDVQPADNAPAVQALVVLPAHLLVILRQRVEVVGGQALLCKEAGPFKGLIVGWHGCPRQSITIVGMLIKKIGIATRVGALTGWMPVQSSLSGMLPRSRNRSWVSATRFRWLFMT